MSETEMQTGSDLTVSLARPTFLILHTLQASAIKMHQKFRLGQSISNIYTKVNMTKIYRTEWSKLPAEGQLHYVK